jgi:hypothetical protein
MNRFKKYDEFNSEVIKIYHSTASKEDAESILKNGFDTKISRRCQNEGDGMGAFFEPFALDGSYGNFCIEFDIKMEDFKKFIRIEVDDYHNEKQHRQLLEFFRKIYGNNESAQVSKEMMKGYVEITRFFEVLSIHLFDPTIAKPVRILEKKAGQKRMLGSW